jgi:hypothetical protein
MAPDLEKLCAPLSSDYVFQIACFSWALFSTPKMPVREIAIPKMQRNNRAPLDEVSAIPTTGITQPNNAKKTPTNFILLSCFL